MSSEAKVEEKHCCISHEFLRAASRNPNKIAVIHASGGARICRESREMISDPCFDEEQLFDNHRKSLNPPVYSGDKFFTCADILVSVNSWSSRIRRVLDGGDDPDLIRPEGYFHGKQNIDGQSPEFAKIGDLTEEQLTNSQCMDPTLISDFAVYIESTTTETNGAPALHGTPQILGIYMVPSVEYIVAVLSVLRCGEAFLPLDPLWPRERILSFVSSSKVGLIVKCTSSFNTSDSHQLHKDDFLLNHDSCSVLYMSMKGNPKEYSRHSDLVWPCQSKKQRMFCYLMYTSGSTGKPKGVCGTEKGLMNRFLWMQALFPLQGEDILLFKTSISFIDHLQEFLSAILTCSPLVVPPFDELKANPFYLVDFLKAYRVSRLTAVPSLMRAIIPAMQCPRRMQVQEFLQVLVLSGEILPISLLDTLLQILPETSILNLYGSTEVSGDCTYFDCKKLPMILETDSISSVPIGVPISNCNILLHGESGEPDEGEIHVGGSCVFTGYLCDPIKMSSDHVKLVRDPELCHDPPVKDSGNKVYFRTGDYARRLQSGDFVFLGRKDRTVKINGHRVALEEIEDMLREHPDVVDAAVTFTKGQTELLYLGAYIVLKSKDQFLKEQLHSADEEDLCEKLSLSIKSWLVKRLPTTMIPTRYLFMESLPLSSSGKVDYALLEGSTFVRKQDRNEIDSNQSGQSLLPVIKKAFCDTLMVEEVLDYDDFFLMGGNSITAAQVAHKLGIDMRLIYIFPSPSKLLSALLNREELYENGFSLDPVLERKSKKPKESMRHSLNPSVPDLLERSLQVASREWVHNFSQKLNRYPPRTFFEKNDDSHISYLSSEASRLSDGCRWVSSFYLSTVVSFSRCNKFMYGGEAEVNNEHRACQSTEIARNLNGDLQELWKVPLESCVDASPLVVLKNGKFYLFIGSHSHIFLCVDALSGSVLWDTKLEGRIECSATITGDFSQVVVGCYKGKIYFLDFMSGNISWEFQTGGEVKSQPVVDKCRNVIWCGSYDHNLYALDYINHCFVHKISCGGSIYGSPSIDRVHNMLYVASTSGRITSISLKELPFSIMWMHETGAPIFGSLSINSLNGNVICCLVDGHVIALNLSGSIIWKAVTSGPIFAGACISSALPSQVLICSRSGSVYSFELEGGDLLWELHVGDPITSSAYIDEHIQLISDHSPSSDRLACVCSSSGSIHVLRINPNAKKERNQHGNDPLVPMVQEYAKMDLPGDIFSSPVMIGGRIFVGCRNDHVYCISVVW